MFHVKLINDAPLFKIAFLDIHSVTEHLPIYICVTPVSHTEE